MGSSNEYMREYLRRRYRERRRLAIETLGGGCAKCGSKTRLEVDHVDRTKKTMSFDRMYKVSMARFMEELARCQLLCRDCHEQKTIVDVNHEARAHGNVAMYRHGGCRCDRCRDANTAYQRTWRNKKLG